MAASFVKPMVQTEVRGKMFEMAICLIYLTAFNGKYNYEMDWPIMFAPRLKNLKYIHADKCVHTAKRGGRYDYTSIGENGSVKHLSAKTTEKSGKVAPQVIGQTQPKKFCELTGLSFTTNTDLKRDIQTNILQILPILVQYTFDCPIVYYNETKDKILYITLDTPIEWDLYEFSWTQKWEDWNNSTTLKIKYNLTEHSLVEFQFHTKSRTNMAIRWTFEKFLDIFKDNLTIVDIEA